MLIPFYLIFCWIRNTGQLESFFPFKAGPASATMSLLTFVATPCISVGYLQGCTELDNLMFAKMRKRSFESQLWVSKSLDSKPLHGLKRSDELRSTIRINN